MSIVSIRAALETKLNTITPALATVWENIGYTPVAGIAYQAAYILPADTENPTMGDDFHRELGLFQVSLFYPVQAGTATAAARAELIKTAFKRGTSMVSGTVTVRINRTPSIGQGRVDGDRWHIPVKIQYFADIQ